MKQTGLIRREKLCACGCGNFAGFYRKTAKRGEPRRFIHGHHGRKAHRYVVDDHGFTTPCWIWLLALDEDGYAIDGRRRAARLHYERLHGLISADLVIDHLCRNRACVNPAHLELVTNRENILRGESPAARNARKQTCPRGHHYDTANTYTTPEGGRHCRACGREKWHERKVSRAA